MARMNMRLRRDAPGVSVFWMILGVGAAVFLLVGVFLYATGDETQLEPAEPDVIAGEGDEVPGTSSFGAGEVAEQGMPPDLPGEAGEVDESVPETGQADDDAEAGTVGAVDADPAEPAPDPAVPAVEGETGGEEPAEAPAQTEQPAEAEAEPADGEPGAEAEEELQE